MVDPPPPTFFFTVDLADPRSQNGPAQISESDSLFCFIHRLFIYLSEQPWNSHSFIQGCSDGIQNISEGSKYKSNRCKNGNYNNT